MTLFTHRTFDVEPRPHSEVSLAVYASQPDLQIALFAHKREISRFPEMKRDNDLHATPSTDKSGGLRELFLLLLHIPEVLPAIFFLGVIGTEAPGLASSSPGSHRARDTCDSGDNRLERSPDSSESCHSSKPLPKSFDTAQTGKGATHARRRHSGLAAVE